MVCLANKSGGHEDMQRRELETAAANYSYLRGLLYLPVGGLCVLAALGNWQVGPLRHAWVFLLAALAIAAVAVALNRYYNERYGRLTPSTAQQVRACVGLVLAVALMLGGASLLRSHASWSLDLPVNAIAVCFALVMLVTYAIGVGLKTHHVVIWGTVLVAGALPVWNGPDPGNIGLLLAGAGVILTGVFDHRLFVRTFGPPHAIGYENGDVPAH
jgi:4-hydroxybenzoate polyprenyltransferase